MACRRTGEGRSKSGRVRRCNAPARCLAGAPAGPQRGRRAASVVGGDGPRGRGIPARLRPSRPLTGIRVLDLTRVLAGPVATRFLAGFGAEVLRIDPPWWDEPAVVPEVVLGKRCARLDLRTPDGREGFLACFARRTCWSTAIRPDALARLGLGAETRRQARPGLIDVSLDAYGWTGPWRGRRGFDSLVQMSAGIADEGMRRFGKDRPTPLPVQALDHATGYLWRRPWCAVSQQGSRRGADARRELRLPGWRRSFPAPRRIRDHVRSSRRGPPTFRSDRATPWGTALRLKPPLMVAGAPMRWDHRAAALGSSPAAW